MRSYGILFSVLACLALLPVTGHADEKEIGKVLVVDGKLWILSEGQLPGKVAKVDDTLTSKDTVKTGADSTAKIILQNDEVVVIAANTEIDLSDYLPAVTEKGAKEEHVIKVNRGKLRIIVKEGYGKSRNLQLKSSNCIAGVVGTDFVFEYNPEENETTVAVLSGTVQVAHAWLPGVKVLGPGDVVTVIGDEAPIEPERLKSDELEKLRLFMPKPPVSFLQMLPGSAPSVGGIAETAGTGDAGVPLEAARAPITDVSPSALEISGTTVPPSIPPEVGPPNTQPTSEYVPPTTVEPAPPPPPRRPGQR